jgi:hypothetical protein
MAEISGKNVQAFVRAQLEQVQRRVQGIEADAEKVLDAWKARLPKSRAELEAAWNRANASGPLKGVGSFEEWSKRVETVRAEAQKRLTDVQIRARDLANTRGKPAWEAVQAKVQRWTRTPQDRTDQGSVSDSERRPRA